MSAPAIVGAIAAISGELAKTGIEKSRRNQQQGYAFRGIDDVYAALTPLLAKHRVAIVPYVEERTTESRETKSGGTLAYTTVAVKYTAHSADDGSSVEARTFGEAMDSADKATNKAMSAAYKYMALMLFGIPTEGDNDADATTHEVKPEPPRLNGFAQMVAAFGEIKKRIGDAAYYDILREYGVEHANEFRSMEKARAAFAAMKKQETA